MSDNPTPTLAELLEWSKTHVMTDEEKEAQRQSFAYGNTNIENSRITREMVDDEAAILNESRKA